MHLRSAVRSLAAVRATPARTGALAAAATGALALLAMSVGREGLPGSTGRAGRPAAASVASLPLFIRRLPVPERLLPIPAESVGMSGARLGEIGTIVRRGIAAGGFPGAAVVIGRRGGTVLERGFGHTDWAAGAAPVDPDRTLYDLASLTKVVATTSAIMALYDDGVIALDDRASRWVPAFRGGMKDRITIRQLLTHRSGLPAGRDLWRYRGDPAAARAAVLATPLVRGCPPGACYIYSDLGADVLADVVEAATHESLARFVHDRVFGPLGMTSTTFRPRGGELARLARTGAPLGRVHDGNAAVLGGVAGHAGLFSTAGDLAVFAQMLLNGGEYGGVRIFADSTVRLFTTRAAGTRALGWDTCDTGSRVSTCGRYFGPRAYGHLGFTGTSLWIDPDRKLFVLVLTNRVDRPRVRRPALVIHDIRADVADAAVLAVRGAGAEFGRQRPAFRSDSRRRWGVPIPRASRRLARAPSRARRGAARRAR